MMPIPNPNADCVDIVVEDTRWANHQHVIIDAVGQVLTHLDVAPTAEVAILACDDARIAGLNESFRSKDRATNVLSWPSFDFPNRPEGAPPPPPMMPELGDIAVSFDTCMAEAQAQGKPFHDHLTHLIVHGTLHLLGYDHICDADATLMEGIEVAILAKLGISDPYMDQQGKP